MNLPQKTSLALGLFGNICSLEVLHLLPQLRAIGGLEGLRFPDLLVLVTQTAERAPNCRVLNPRVAMVPGFVCTGEGLATGRAPTACGAQMAKAGRRGSRILRRVRWIALHACTVLNCAMQ
jgi:hypothetical protein